MTKKRRKIAYGTAALCGVTVFGVVLFPYFAPRLAEGGETSAASIPTPIPVPSATTLPVASPGPASLPSPTPSVSPSGTPRNISQFENAGILTVTPETSSAQYNALLNQTRSFILRKLNERQYGQIALVTSESAGRTWTRSFFVERNSVGSWIVTLESPQVEPTEFKVIEQVGVGADGRPILTPRPGDLPPVSWALHLKTDSTARYGIIL